MAIAIALADAFDIETYDGLVAYVIAHLELDGESEAQVPTFIRQAEYRLNRLCTAPERETSIIMTTTAGEQSVALPVDYRQLRAARFVADDGYPLAQASLNVLHSDYSGTSGRPQAFCISEQAVHFGPMPDGEYTIYATYLARIPPLSPTNQTNWLLSGNADAYVYATLMQASVWLEDLEAATTYRAELMSIIDEVNLQGNRYRMSGPIRMRSPVVV